MDDNNQEIPLNATIRQEYAKCGDPDCQNPHGPYLYAYWKQGKKLKEIIFQEVIKDCRVFDECSNNIAKHLKIHSEARTCINS
jgi:hypothetical protein